MELKNKITKMEISLEEFKGRFEQIEETTSEAEDKTMQII